MYCSSCGVAIAPSLTYCNHCGAKTNNERSDTVVHTTQARYESFIMSVIASLFVGGLVAISLLLGVMKAVLGFEAGPLIAFAFLTFFTLVGIEGILISHLFRRKRGRQKSEDSPIAHITKELEARSRGFGEPVNSVTDHTTRTLDPIYSEKK
jgi:hypothetical protein